MFRHYDQADECEVKFAAYFVENLDEEVTSPHGAEEREAPVTTASDEMKMMMSVTALESSRHQQKLPDPQTKKRQRPPALRQRREERGTRNCKPTGKPGTNNDSPQN